ncbi:YoaK family protein [Cellulosimicrobium cellulans]|uniref:YoaK family protein n=1 Tax=Cellulosimicrobium cellulans TaxID=1710 RepID=UPI00030D289B|nr:YoaK family protein [Cellulosimicrobium cellulans]
MTDPRDRPYVAGLLVLTVATGVVDAVSYLALDQVFTGNMTGNVLFVGFAAAGAGGIPLLNNVVALVAFVLGAALCGVLLRGRADDARMPRRALGVLAGGAVLVVAGGALWLVVGRLPTPGVLALTAALALAMGAQAVAARGAHVQDVSTVVVTTTLVNLALSSPLAGGSGEGAARRAGAVLAMGTGAAVGAVVVRSWSGAAGLLLAGLLVAVGTTTLALARRHDAVAPR